MSLKVKPKKQKQIQRKQTNNNKKNGSLDLSFNSSYKFVSLKVKPKKQKQRKQTNKGNKQTKKKKMEVWIFQCGHFVALYSCPVQKFNTMAYFVHSGDLI